MVYHSKDKVAAALAAAQQAYDNDPDPSGPLHAGRIVPSNATDGGPNWTVDVGEGVSGDPFTFTRAIVEVQARMPMIDPAEL